MFRANFWINYPQQSCGSILNFNFHNVWLNCKYLKGFIKLKTSFWSCKNNAVKVVKRNQLKVDRKNADFRICIDCNEAERLKIKEKKTATQLPTVIYVCPSLRHLFTFKNAREYNPMPAGGLYISLHNSFSVFIAAQFGFVLFFLSRVVLLRRFISN